MECGLFSEWLTRYQYHLRMRNYSPRTIQTYSDVVRHFAQYVWMRRHAKPGKLVFYWEDLSEARTDTDVNVTGLLVTDYLSFLTTLRTYKPKTLHRIVSSLSSFYRFLSSQGAVTANPVVGIERPRIKEQQLIYLKHNQVLQLLTSIDAIHDRLIIRTIYATGMRVSELCSVNIEDIDFEEHIIKVKGKGDKYRTVFLDDETLSDIQAYIGDRFSGPLFLGQQGKHISPRTVQRIFKHYAPKGITPHKIRHSYASELYKRSKNLRVVQENLGHSSIKTTEIYLHTDLDERKRVYREYFPLGNGGEGQKEKKRE
jgi:integrase/recombinase XerC